MKKKETILLASGITVQKGDSTVYTNSKFDYLQSVLCGSLTLHISRININVSGKRLFFAKEKPARTDQSIHRSNELDGESMQLLSLSAPSALLLKKNPRKQQKKKENASSNWHAYRLYQTIYK